MTWTIRNVIVYLLDLVMAAITFFLGLDIVFKLLGTNPNTPFVAWILGISQNLMYPFSGIFPNLATGGNVLDIVAVISLLAYLILFYITISLIDGLLRPRGIYSHDPERLV